MEKLYFAGSSKFDYTYDGEGNLMRIKSNKVHLQNDKKVQLTNDYYFMKEINEDCYVALDIAVVEPERLIDFDDSLLAFKYGIISLTRDENGKVIPYGEKVVTPFYYDKINCGGNQTAIAELEGRLTYIDINPKSENFGKQLIPAVLTQACPFSAEYEDFAECSIGDESGYLLYDTVPKTKLSIFDLVTEERVKQKTLGGKK